MTFCAPSQSEPCGEFVTLVSIRRGHDYSAVTQPFPRHALRPPGRDNGAVAADRTLKGVA
jgi:hypothetical protein